MRNCKILILFVALISITSVVAGQSAEETIAKGQNLEKSQKFDDAIALYKEYLSKTPAEKVFIEAASLLGKLKRYDEAEKLLNQALSEYPGNNSLTNLLALIKLRQGHNDTAKKLWNTVLERTPGDSFAAEWLKKMDTLDGELASPQETIPTPADGAASVDIAKADAPLSKDEQKALAKKLYEEMIPMDKWETDRIIAIHREVIERCPLTDQAEESCWRLSNLYIRALDEPDHESNIEILEYLLKTYPQTPLYSEAKNSLTISYKLTGRYDKLAELYEELFKMNPTVPDKEFMIWGVEYGDALLAVGRREEALEMFRQVVQRDNNRDMMAARVAKKRLEEN